MYGAGVGGLTLKNTTFLWFKLIIVCCNFKVNDAGVDDDFMMLLMMIVTMLLMMMLVMIMMMNHH